MPKKLRPEGPQPRRCVCCHVTLEVKRHRLCRACEAAFSDNPKAPTAKLTSEEEGIVKLCRAWGVPIADVLADAFEAAKKARRPATTEDGREIHYIDGPLPRKHRTAHRRQGARLYNQLVAEGKGWKEAAQAVMKDDVAFGLFESLDDVKNEGSREKRRGR